MRRRWQADLAGICTRSLIVGVATVAVSGCDRPGHLALRADDPPTAADVFSRQVHLDVVAIVAGMTMAHGVQAVWLMPAR